MKILHVAKKYPDIMGGDSTVVAGLEKYQQKIGHQVYILTSNCNEIRKTPHLTKFALKIDSLNLDRVNLNRIISLFMLFFYSFYYLRKIKPDIVHSHSPDMGFILSFACRLYKIPVINTCHGITFADMQYSLIKRKTEEFFLKYGYFRKITTVSKNSLNDFKRLKIKNMIYLPNGIDLDLFKKRQHNINKKTVFLYVGRIELDKGLKYLINAADKLRKREDNFELLLIGKGLDQVYFQNLVVESGLTDRVKFLGKKNIAEVIDYYYKSDVFISPTLHETFPMTVLEAWAAELAVIITSVGGIPAICINRENALVVPPENPEEIVMAMSALIRDPKLRLELAENGRKLVEEKYGWDKIVQEFESIYKEIVK